MLTLFVRFASSVGVFTILFAGTLAQAAVAQTLDDVSDFRQLIQRYNAYDFDQDGHVEIERLQLLADQFEESDFPAESNPGVLVLIEQRLLDNDQQLQPAGKLASQLKDYAVALNADHLRPCFIAVKMEKSERHQDGKTLLALRRFLKDVHQATPDFQGVILIGSFPEAMLVRRWAWLHSSRSVKFGDVTYNKGKGPRATYLAFDPELISHRSDVVLSDLDGNWEDIYVQPKTDVDSIKLIPDDPEVFEQFRDRKVQFASSRFSIRPKSFQDFFFIDDAQLEILSQDDSQLNLVTTYQMRLPEVTQTDRQLVNPLAMPDILVSRINPLHVAANPPSFAVDENGLPQDYPADSGEPVFRRDPSFERQLLIEYLERNLKHRSGQTPALANRSALVTTDIRTFNSQYLQKLSDQFSEGVAFHKADVVAFSKFMKTPAVVKAISAHSGPGTSVLIRGFDAEALENESGGHYWQWQKSGDQYKPSYADKKICNTVHTSLLRALWKNQQLPESGSFYIHGGCEAVSPMSAATQPYHSKHYGGHTQTAESLMFYGGGLALIGRAKVFYDSPRNPHLYFSNTNGRFGDILRGYFQEEAADAKVGRDVAGRNRCYFWSILGDWTLKLNYPNQ